MGKTAGGLQRESGTYLASCTSGGATCAADSGGVAESIFILLGQFVIYSFFSFAVPNQDRGYNVSAQSRISCGAAIALLGLLFSPADATVEVLEAQGNLEHWVLYHGGHSPCSGASWSHEVEEGTAFDLRSANNDEGCVVSSWAGHCSSGGFVYSGEISPVTSGTYGWSVYLQCQITVLLDVTTPTWITAARTAEGIYSPSAHTVTLTLPDGTSEILLGPDLDTDSAERLLGLGLFRVTFSIESDWVWSIPFSYSGFVEVNWNGGTGQDAPTWGDIKCMYRSQR